MPLNFKPSIIMKNLNQQLLKFCMLALLFYGCEEILLIPDISNATVKLVGPSNNVEVPAGDLSFNWEYIEDAEAFRIQIATPNFTEVKQVVLDTLLPVVIDSIIPVTKTNKVLNAGKYQWRVKAINSGYETSYTTHNLTVIE